MDDKEKENKSHKKNTEDIYIILIDLINKKNEKLNTIKKTSEIFEIIEKNNITSLLNDFDMITEKKYFNIKNEKEEIKNILISLSIESRIKNLINSILWILNNFNKYIKYKSSPFYDFIKNIYKAFEKKTITISILIDCINFLKSKRIIEENLLNIKSDLFIDFLILIEGQLNLKDNAINFCIKKSEEEIEDVINNIKNSDINFLNLNDINDFKSCCNFLNELTKEKIDNDLILIKILKKNFEKDTSIYTKFKNYFRYYKNIELLYKESTSSINTTFQSTVDNFLENSEIIITNDELNNIVCDLIIIKNNEKKNFEEIYEIKEMVFVNYKNDIKNGKKFSKFFEIIDGIKKLIEKLNILYNNGYPYHKKFHIKIEEGNLLSNGDNTKINLSEIINNINDLNNSFKKTQIFYFEKNPILTFINTKLYSYILSKEKNSIIKLKEKNLLKYITNNMIQKKLKDFDFSEEKVKNYDLNYFFESLVKYLELTFEENKITIKNILEKNFILDEFNYIKGGIFYIEYNQENLEFNILNIYQEITGNYPLNNTLLICDKDTTFENIYIFLFSFFLCEYPLLFMLINLEIFDLSLKYKIILLIQKLSKIYNNRKSSLIILGQCLLDNNHNEINFKKKINEISENKMIILDKKDEKNIKYKFNNVKIITSEKSGLGVSSYIKHKVIKENKMKYIYFPLGGNFTRKEIFMRLKNININEEENCNWSIHIEINQTNYNLYSLLKEFLFKILVLKYYDFSNDIFYLGDKINIIIELPFSFINYFSLFPFLSIFEIIQVNKLYPLRFINNNIKKVKDSNEQIVAKTLRNYYIKYINKINIDLESEDLLSEINCENTMNVLFQEHTIRENYY